MYHKEIPSRFPIGLSQLQYHINFKAGRAPFLVHHITKSTFAVSIILAQLSLHHWKLIDTYHIRVAVHIYPIKHVLPNNGGPHVAHHHINELSLPEFLHLATYIVIFLF